MMIIIKGGGFMDRVTLGNTGITVCRNGFGALPIQRIGKEDAAYLVQKAYKTTYTFGTNASVTYSH